MPDRRIRGVRDSGAVGGYDVASYLTSLGVGGVLMSGALSWECRPTNSVTHAVVAGAADTDGSADEVVSAGSIARPYYVTHLAWALDQSAIHCRFKILEGTNVVRIFTGISRENTQDVPMLNRIYPPYRMAANASTNVIMATTTGTETANYYLEIMRGTPLTILQFTSRLPRQSQTVLPIGAVGADEIELLSPEVNAIPGTWGDYTEIDAGQTGAYLIYGVTLIRKQSQDNIMAFATGAEGSEVVWGTFGTPTISTEGANSQIFYDLRPWPVYVPPATRLSGRCQYVDGINHPPSRGVVYLSAILL